MFTSFNEPLLCEVASLPALQDEPHLLGILLFLLQGVGNAPKSLVQGSWDSLPPDWLYFSSAADNGVWFGWGSQMMLGHNTETS